MAHFSFQRGDQVEICSKLDGFFGSYYEATVVANMGTNYVIQYRNLVEEFNESEPLKETVKASEVRPLPPEIRGVHSAVFHVDDRIDAYDLDGWWVGTVSSEDNGSGFHSVFFEYTGQELEYPVLNLRVHQDWRNGKWVSSKKTKRGAVR
ncbi:protein AGENET DOMAIN (AGD)-CONTAINING P1 [Argentina anserina]|uniref:protein AGENET DOMAIN (AGD)-CONTAINING P1 n=1 Tax=Argentina anserina TaxID=57926 RepID=UPI00217633E3|nr:protein AGENET DOMAIN (AGD)-CONTAINING P1 [Potentilla anserina]